MQLNLLRRDLDMGLYCRTAHLCSAGPVDETGHSDGVHSWYQQADQPRRSYTEVRHPATVVISMCNRVNNLEVALGGDDYQPVHRPEYNRRHQRLVVHQKAD